MATRQYIGARYIPKFYVNGSGTSEWTANTAYEALTIVTRNGNSYTSKIPVPASVGAPENNAAYWVSTGIYNQQVEEYRQEVAAVSSALNDLKTDFNTELYSSNPVGMKKAIIIADSYGVRENGRLINTLVGKCGLSGNYWSSAIGSTGFAHAANGQTFLTMLNTLAQSLTAEDLADVTHIIVLGGSNDTLESDSAVTSAISAFYNRARELCTNAIIYIGFVGVKFDWTQSYKYGNTCAVYKRCANNLYRCKYLSGVEYCLHNISYLDADLTHPNVSGCDALAGAVYNALTGSGADISYPMLQVGTIGNTQSRNVYMRLDNNVMEIFTNNYSKIEFDTEQVLLADGQTAFDLVTLNTMGYGPGDGYQANGEHLTILCKNNTVNYYTQIPGYLEYSNGIIKWHPFFFSGSTENPGTITFNKMVIPRFNLRMSTIWN